MHIRTRLRVHGATFLRDACVVFLAYFAALATRFDAHIPYAYGRNFVKALPVILLVYAVSTYIFGVHRRIWRYPGMADLQAMIQAGVLAAVVLGVIDLVVDQRYVPLSVIIMGGTYAIGSLLAVRLWRSVSHGHAFARRDTGSSVRVLIAGAGRAGQLVAADLRASPHLTETPVGFLDDDPRLAYMSIQGLPVLGQIDDLPDVVRRHNVDSVAVALPSASTQQIDRVLQLALSSDVRLQMLPSQAEVLAGRSNSMQLRDVNLNALLDRIPSTHALEGPLVRQCVQGKVVLVTGAAGSIGSELCRQIVTLAPSKLLALDNNETGLFHLQRELAHLPGGDVVTPILTSVTADPKLSQVFERYRPHLVYHAAAYKHVPMLEGNSDEAVFVNVKGTFNVCRAAARYGCERFVFVSTDKAVHPVNTLGFSKRIGELLVRAHQGTSDTVFCAVRFGNVIGSRGSALPEFLRQIDAGGPVTVTHPDVERYFMTISEAVSLVIQASSLAHGGEIFMLDMGEPIKIGELVNRLIRLRGLRPGKDIEIIYTGLRPGEKLSEELVFSAESTEGTEIPRVHIVRDTIKPDLKELSRSVALLVDSAAHADNDQTLTEVARVARGEPPFAEPYASTHLNAGA